MSEASGNSVAPTVLLVEDNPTDVFVIKEVIAECGLKVSLRVVSDGQEALRYVQSLATSEASSCPALVLLDLNVPKVAGIEILRQLRSGSRCNNTPVIVVTSSMAEADRAAVQKLGAEAYFPKPKSLAAYMQLARLIERVLCEPDNGN